MRSYRKIGVRILLAYFISLPALLGLHATHHLHTDDTDHRHKSELSFSSSSDCDLCDLYLNQSAVLSNYSLIDDLAAIPSYLISDASIIATGGQFTSLRGPPHLIPIT